MVPFKLADLIPNVLYKLEKPFTFHDGKEASEFTAEELFLYADDKLLHSLDDGALIDPKVLQKARINLLPPSKWEKSNV